MGSLLRIAGADADALGLEIPDGPAAATGDGPFDMDHVTEALDQVYDPEIPVSIVQLGLVYRCEEVVDADGARRIELDMTMTAPGCGMGDVLQADAPRAERAVPRFAGIVVYLCWEPPWIIHPTRRKQADGNSGIIGVGPVGG